MAAFSGVTTVTAVGSAVPLGSGRVAGRLLVKADPENTGFMYVGNDGNNDVDSATGMKLDAGDEIVFAYIGELSSLYVDASVINEKVCWIMLDIM